MTAHARPGSVLKAEALPMNGIGGYFVFWQTANAYGSRGSGLSKEAAERLAERLLNGEERP